MSTKIKSRLAIVALSIVLFIIFTGVSFESSGYVLPFGWKRNTQDFVITEDFNNIGNKAIYDRPISEDGFPFEYNMSCLDWSDCSNKYNTLAIFLNLLIALTLSVSISWSLVNIAERKQK